MSPRRLYSTTTAAQSALRLFGKTCLVTGGSQGIGLAIANRFASEGASVILMSRSREKLELATSKLPLVDDSQNHIVAPFDLSQGRGFTASDVGTKLTDIDVLVNCAGVAQSSLLLSTPKETIDNLVNLNLLGTIYATQSLIKPMIRKKRGCIINISSVLGVRGMKGTSVYAATKAGVTGFTKSLAVELGGRNIRVNSICPGLVDTEMATSVDGTLRDLFTAQSPSKQLIPTSAIADAALTLVLSEHINGAELIIDGGFTAWYSSRRSTWRLNVSSIDTTTFLHTCIYYKSISYGPFVYLHNRLLDLASYSRYMPWAFIWGLSRMVRFQDVCVFWGPGISQNWEN